jgi:hypothetical protein
MATQLLYQPWCRETFAEIQDASSEPMRQSTSTQTVEQEIGQGQGQDHTQTGVEEHSSTRSDHTAMSEGREEAPDAVVAPQGEDDMKTLA